MRILLTAILLLLSACASSEPKDLKFNYITVVNAKDEPQLWGFERNRKDIDFDKLRLLKVVFSSAVDIVNFAKINSYNIGYAVYLCDERDMIVSEVFGVGYIRLLNGSRSINDPMYFDRGNIDDMRGSDGKFYYYALVPLLSEDMRRVYSGGGGQFGGKKIQIYDSRAGLYNLCISLKGGRMGLFGSFSSNYITIPKESIFQQVK